MKIFTLFLFLGFTLLLFSQRRDKQPQLFQNTHELFKDSIWIATTECSNLEYSAYLKSTIIGLTEKEAAKLTPKNLLWKSIEERPKPYEEYYFGHPAYHNFPVVNISIEQAMLFCEWKTTQVNKYLSTLAEKEKKGIKKVRVRLPKDVEWKFAALGGLPGYSDYPWKGLGMRVEKGKDIGNFRANFKDNYGDIKIGRKTIKAEDDLISPVNAFYKNGYGLYNMSGNVAELIEDKYIVRGGHWDSFKDGLRLNTFEYYTGASPYVGFRYVIEVEN